MIKLAVSGAAGRMGSRIIALAAADSRFETVAALEKADHACIGQDAGQLAGLGPSGLAVQERLAVPFDAFIDFALPAGTMHWLETCLSQRKPMVIGTTGHSPAQSDAIRAAAERIAIVRSTNMSIGVNLLFQLVGQVAAVLGDDYDIEIVEAHHRFKVDAPSGTAITLRDKIIAATQRNAEQDVIYGRQGHSGPRPARQIGMHALRVGDTVGEHEVHFGSLGETVVLKHSAHTRDTFVKGALRAAAWIVDRPPGLYDMQDVLKLTSP